MAIQHQFSILVYKMSPFPSYSWPIATHHRSPAGGRKPARTCSAHEQISLLLWPVEDNPRATGRHDQVASTATMLPPHPLPTFTPGVHDAWPVRKP